MAVFDTDFTAVDDMFAEVFGDTVDYYRGALSAEITVEPITLDDEINEVEGFSTGVRRRSYAIRAVDLVIDGVTITPQTGDRIKETIGSSVLTFELAQRDDRPPYLWSDVRGGSWIVFANLVE
jgi:hypothetical protein